MIYADHAATTRLQEEAFEAMKPFLLEQYANASQPYSFARAAKKTLAESRAIIAACIGADPSEIYFTSGGTESDNWAVKSLLYADTARELITSSIEHHAVLHAAGSIEKLGCRVQYLPVDESGVVKPESLKKWMSRETGLVSVMLSNNEVGTIEPVKELADIAHAHGAVFHTDAVQSVGHIPVDVKQLGVDMLSASAHKFGGPKGAGFLYCKAGVNLPVFHDGGSQEAGRRAGTEDIASIAGMAAALEGSCRRMEEDMVHLVHLEDVLLGILRSAGKDFIRNGSKNHVPGNMSLSFRGEQGERLLHRLDLKGICVSTGSACNSESTEISHVLRAMHLPEEYAYGTIRISLGYENTEEEVRQIGEALLRILH